ncbi:uncharacterized protein LOC105423765 [Pogonomyrmex barbatus]|uniref:Uncharacterized protein LOC105423765 n=1 Tax=Pogonomyrmex barbatus TaxID=144034 RepID=A0A8N1S319_9HYME|nr:uncharacterized protein LOC105423765 [Pogonomyrmex barbatus]
MLPRRRFQVLVLIILTLCQVSTNNKPISPSQQQIVMSEGESLKIICTGFTPIKFVYPDEFGELVNTSTPEINETEENGIYKYIFQRSKAVFGDTGWYGCTDHNMEIITNSSTISSLLEVNQLYVYVKSSTNLFVEADTYAHLNAIAGGSIVIPCRTTSPDLIPILFDNNEEEIKATFDPRIGFTITNLLVKDSNWYKCSIEKDGEEHMVNYVLSVHRKYGFNSRCKFNYICIYRCIEYFIFK